MGSADAKVDRESAPYKKSASYYDYFIQQHVSPPDAASCTIKECTELQCGDFVGAMGDRQKARRAYFISLCVMNMWKVANEMHVRRSLWSPSRRKPASKLIISRIKPMS